MARGRRGAPAPAAAVSGPGALSRRTDQQPIRTAAGGTPGVQNAALPALQQAAPLAAGTSSTPSAGAPPPEGAFAGLGAFGPTTRPNEDPTAGLSTPASQLEQDPDALTRILYTMYPHPDIARLLKTHSGP